ncbi:MAG: hypothetical protein AAF213_09745 [Pseudomonadota bacterium]
MTDPQEPKSTETQETQAPQDTQAPKAGFSIDQVDWPVVRQKASAITATALCLVTFMFVAGASVGTARTDGALNVLVNALMAALPWAALIGVVSVVILMRRHRRS